MSGPTEAATRRLAQTESTESRKSTQSKVLALQLEGELDVSDGLITVVADMANIQSIRYMTVEKATKRELGMEGIASEHHIVTAPTSRRYQLQP